MADGFALVCMGDTTLGYGIKAETADTDLDLPEQGVLVPNHDLPAIYSPKFKPGLQQKRFFVCDRILQS
ncbi:hypothetical protein AZE42_11974 [Rhizopogon vesiculosus]|uniref:Uncharacterized protein n=1 Tax=Rhizopogon vesiculosus TaxID=180088 RepID=A0A1J8QF79_9AGAM|nr:hypothetical protein AZE42_11974 [Rhizopogon vesiculosus]